MFFHIIRNAVELAEIYFFAFHFHEMLMPFAEQEEDVLSFAQFGSVAQKFFERRRNRRFGVDSDGVDFKNKIHSI